MDYGCQLYSTTTKGRFIKLDSVYIEGIRIDMEDFRTLPMETLHIEANKLSLNMCRNELGQRFLYKLGSNQTYMEALAILDDIDNCKYIEHENYKINSSTYTSEL